jgi:hypothetical protein
MRESQASIDTQQFGSSLVSPEDNFFSVLETNLLQYGNDRDAARKFVHLQLQMYK